MISNLRTLLDRIRKRDFSGNSGLTIKNSIYVFLSNFISKIGSIIFTIILARMLMPELFGLYSLALTTILLFVGLSEFGFGRAFITYVSKEIGRNKEGKAKAYALFLLKIKLIAIIGTSILLIFLSKLIANNYYQKPIHLSLLVGALYVFFIGVSGTLEFFFQAINNFKISLYKEILFQIMRIVLIPLTILYLINESFSNEMQISSIIFVLAIIWLFISIFIYLSLKKVNFLKSKTEKLSKQEKNDLKKFIRHLFLFNYLMLFFTQIDILFLGRFVSAELISFYAIAIGLIGSLGSLIAFSGVLLPIFSKLKKERLEEGLKKSIILTFIISFIIFIFILIFSGIIIKVIYGSEYLPSINLLRLLSPMIITFPIMSIYLNYFISKGKSFFIVKWMIILVILNIVLNYLIMLWLMKYGEMAIIFGIGIVTILTKIFFLFILWNKHRG